MYHRGKKNPSFFRSAPVEVIMDVTSIVKAARLS